MAETHAVKAFLIKIDSGEYPGKYVGIKVGGLAMNPEVQ